MNHCYLRSLKFSIVGMLVVIGVVLLTSEEDYHVYELDPVQLATDLNIPSENPKEILLACCRFARLQNEETFCTRYTSDCLPHYLYHFDHWSETGGIQEKGTALIIDYVTTEKKRVGLTYTPKGLLRCVVGLNVRRSTCESVANYKEEAGLTREEKRMEREKAYARRAQSFIVPAGTFVQGSSVCKGDAHNKTRVR